MPISFASNKHNVNLFRAWRKEIARDRSYRALMHVVANVTFVKWTLCTTTFFSYKKKRRKTLVSLLSLLIYGSDGHFQPYLYGTHAWCDRGVVNKLTFEDRHETRESTSGSEAVTIVASLNFPYIYIYSRRAFILIRRSRKRAERGRALSDQASERTGEPRKRL